MRERVLAVSASRRAEEGQQTKAEMVYRYFTGSQFRHRVQAIVEKFQEMRTDLEKERRFLQTQWAKREQQINCAVVSTVGMRGDLMGIAGQSVLEIEEFDLIDGPEEAPFRDAAE